MPLRFHICLLASTLALMPVSSMSWAGEVFEQVPSIAASQTTEGEKIESTAQKITSILNEGPTANWIWGGDAQKYVFRKTFNAEAGSHGELIASCDNLMKVLLNGKQIASSSEWQSPSRVEISKHLQAGENELIVEAANQGGVAALAVKIAVTSKTDKPQYLVTDDSWQVTTQRNPDQREADQWGKPVARGTMGDQPWGNVFDPNAALAANTLRDVFITQPGFQVELLFKVPKEELGSWVSIAFDDQGRLLASDQGGKGLVRITPPAIGSEQPTQVERLDLEITSAQGMLHAFGKLYISVNGGPGSGLYVAEDTTDDDQYDSLTKLKSLRGGGEHGPHALRLGPDGKSIYVIAGNHTDPPQDFEASRIPSNWSEDHLLPRQWDARGHARGKLAPGGWIAKTDPAGESWEIFSMGYRNSYDMDFNADGELFAYDADMEWDMGTSWYRPTRAVHATSGSEFGWRSGTGKWPTYYLDSLPPLVNIGPGSPVGVTFGYGAKFPAKYQNALYLLDWTFGTMYALHLKPDGSTYAAKKEEFLSRTPLPLTDAAIGPDGAMYFTVGGRGTQSALYRVTYVGEDSSEPVSGKNEKGAPQRELRHRLEALHGGEPATDEQLELAWRNLNHEDRFIRYAARVALEHQEVSRWADRAVSVSEADPTQLITALAALARQGQAEHQASAIKALLNLEVSKLSKTQKLDLLRTYSLLFTRLGQPNQAVANQITAQLEPHYPTDDSDLNRELARVLIYLQSPTVIEKTLALMESAERKSEAEMNELLARNSGYGGSIAKMLANHPALDRVHYALVLRNMKYGWTLSQRERYFDQLASLRTKSGGASYQGFIDNIRQEALENALPAERAALEGNIAPPPKPTELPKPKGPGQEWTVAEVEALGSGGLQGRDFEAGRRAFAASRCIVCHRFGGEGGATGPDLTNVAGRFSHKDLAEALIEPSKVISDQYKASTVFTTGGKVITGRITAENNGNLTILTDPEDASKITEIPADEVDQVADSKTSLMPAKLLDVLNREEVLDLMAYLMSRGNPDDAMFEKAKE